MVRPDAHVNAALLAKVDKLRKSLANPAQLSGVLLVRVFANDEFLRIRIVAGIDAHFFHPLRGFHRGFGFEMNVCDDRYIAASVTQTFHDIFEIARVFYCWRGDPHNFAAHFCQLDRFPERLAITC